MHGILLPLLLSGLIAASPLRVAPLLGRPTDTSVTLSVVAGAEAVALTLELGNDALEARDLGASGRLEKDEVREIEVGGLLPGTEYGYRLRARAGEEEEVVEGRFVTRRPPGSPFTFALLSDSHLPVPAPYMLRPRQAWHMSSRDELLRARQQIGQVFLAALERIRDHRPDFLVCLGDMVDLHALGFNPGFPSEELARLAYLDFRAHLGVAGTRVPFFAVIGNWEGENGNLPGEEIGHARRARMDLLPNPGRTTYPQGGSPGENWFAWEWGDALFVVLDVQSYTTTTHTLGHTRGEGGPTDWTLGKEQLAWLEKTLSASERAFKMLLIHHAVGGNGGDAVNSAYGRGGGRAAHVGEQKKVHRLMLDHGARFLFYGHDHVFTDMEVDGIHYTLPGSAGAPWKFETAETGYVDYDPRSGYGLVHVSRDKVVVEFRGLDGTVFKSFEVKAGKEGGAGVEGGETGDRGR